MPFRVSVSEVLNIFDTNLSGESIQACIAAAEATINAICIPAGLPEIQAKEVERWAAAHLASIQDPVALRSRIGDAETWNFPASVTTSFGMGLKLTPHGQQAIMLDTSGSLAKLGLMKGSYRASPRENSDRFK